jgi:hypothetical protein
MRGRKSVLRVLLIMVLSGIFCAASLAAAPAGEVNASCGSKGWYFAEGYTGGDFDTWILIQNPNKTEAVVQFRFFTPNGEPIPWEVSLAGETRYSLYLNTFPGLEKQEVATEVTVKYGDQDGIIAERAMYFNYNTGQGARVGGHSTIGASRLSTSWYLPEGYTGGGFDTYVLLMNPGDADANVQLKLMKPQDGKYYTFKATVPAGRRKTVKLDELVWTKGQENVVPAVTGGEPPVEVKFDDTDVATLIYADKGIVAERAMYFDYYGKAGGSSSIGATGAAPVWYLPEGYTGGDFDTWVMAMNPNSYPVDITYTFYSNTPGFEPVPVTHYDVPPYSRDTIHVDEVAGLEGTDVSTKVTAKKKVQLQAAGTPGQRRMVLFGIDDYDGDGVKDAGLEYAITGDLWDLKHRLYDYGNFTYSYYINQNATVEKFREVMTGLADSVGAEDTLVFAFSGKAVQAADADPIDEGGGDGMDEFLQLYDGNIADDEVVQLIKGINTDNKVSIFNCDHAGGFLDGLGAAATSSPGIFLANCKEGETRVEFDDISNGAFIYYFVEGLSKQAADTDGNGRVSAEEAFAYAEGLALAKSPAEHPQMLDLFPGNLDLTVDEMPANIVAERSVYFRYGGVSDGATSIGASQTFPNWFLAEGYTGGSFDTFVLVMNPYDFWQKLTITYMTPSGVPIVEERDCPPRYRLTIKVDDVPGLEATDVSTRVSARPMEVAAAGSAGGVVVERAMYFTYVDPLDGSRKAGGSCSIGYGTW